MGISVRVAAKRRKLNLRMLTTLLQILLLSTFLASCLSAPKFHLIETEDEGGVEEVGRRQEGDEGQEGGADQRGGNQEDGDFRLNMTWLMQHAAPLMHEP